MSTKETIWLGESDGTHVHMYWELAEREKEGSALVGAPIYLEAGGNGGKVVAVRLPKDLAARLLTALGPANAAKVALVR